MEPDEVKVEAEDVPTPKLANEPVKPQDDEEVLTIPIMSVIVKSSETPPGEIKKAETSLATDRPRPSFNLFAAGSYVRQNELKKVYDDQTGMLISLNDRIKALNE